MLRTFVMLLPLLALAVALPGAPSLGHDMEAAVHAVDSLATAARHGEVAEAAQSSSKGVVAQAQKEVKALYDQVTRLTSFACPWYAGRGAPWHPVTLPTAVHVTPCLPITRRRWPVWTSWRSSSGSIAARTPQRYPNSHSLRVLFTHLSRMAYSCARGAFTLR
jgi:hypothetical protein